MANKYTCNANTDVITIYINDVLHFKLRTGDLITIQSWIENKPIFEVLRTFFFNFIFYGKIKTWKKKYVVEFILKDEMVTTLEYDEKDKWVEVLKLIDKNMPM